MLHLLTDPFKLGMMQHALLAAVLVGVTCAMLGAYVVLRQMAFVGDALAHTAMPGLAVAQLLGWNLFLGALVADLLAALGIGLVSRRRDVREDTAIGIIFTGMFALGIAIITTSMNRSFRDLTHMLFGNILGVSPLDLVLMAGVAALVVATLILLHKELELSSFDPGYAEVIGLKTTMLRLVLLFLLAITVVSGIQAVGVVLTSAMLVTPAATASLVTKKLKNMMLLASVVAVAAGVIGLYVSFYFELHFSIFGRSISLQDVSSGAAIVLASTLIFALTYLGKSMLMRRSARLAIAA
jgi:ABC-type Mn2+/Zn2+ transport system permease subunit